MKEFNIPDLSHYGEEKIMEWHNKPLKEVIEPILKIYLILNLKANKEKYILRTQ